MINNAFFAPVFSLTHILNFVVLKTSGVSEARVRGEGDDGEVRNLTVLHLGNFQVRATSKTVLKKSQAFDATKL